MLDSSYLPNWIRSYLRHGPATTKKQRMESIKGLLAFLEQSALHDKKAQRMEQVGHSLMQKGAQRMTDSRPDDPLMPGPM